MDRTATTGILSSALARRFGAGGYVGRASGRAFDARKLPGQPPYDRLALEIPVLEAGDVNARVWVRIREVEQSLALIEQILQQLPDGPIRVTIGGGGSGEGLGLAEGFRGDVLVVGAARRRPRRALPPARSLLVPVAAARSRDRGQHRRRLPVVQQIVQLLLFGPRSLGPPHAQDLCSRACGGSRSPSRRPPRTRRHWRSLRPISIAPRAAGSAAACRSARSMRARAMAASSKSTRSTTRSTISSASACVSWPRRAMPTC